MKKALTILGVVISLVIILFLINRASKPTNSQFLEKILKDNNYELVDDQNDSYYIKRDSDMSMNDFFQNVKNNIKSEYEEFYFYPGTYNLAKLKMTYDDHITYNYTANKNLKTNDLSYKYEVSVYSSSIIVGGEYSLDKDDFKCDIISSNDIDEKDVELYCSHAEYETLLFVEDTMTFESNPQIDEIINKGHKEVIVD